MTSGTIFASRKLSFTDLLAALCLFVDGAKGMSAVRFSRDLDVQYKTAFVLAHKLREALAAETSLDAHMVVYLVDNAIREVRDVVIPQKPRRARSSSNTNTAAPAAP